MKRISRPAGQTLHLLHGDLRRLVAGARKTYLRWLERNRGKAEPESLRGHQEVVDFGDRFLAGGIFVVSVKACQPQLPTFRLGDHAARCNVREADLDSPRDPLRLAEIELAISSVAARKRFEPIPYGFCSPNRTLLRVFRYDSEFYGSGNSITRSAFANRSRKYFNLGSIRFPI